MPPQNLQVLAQRGEVKGEIGDTHIEVILRTRRKTNHHPRPRYRYDRGRGAEIPQPDCLFQCLRVPGKIQRQQHHRPLRPGLLFRFYGGRQSGSVTKSWQEGAEAVRWTCAASGVYTIEKVEKAERGTDIILLHQRGKQRLPGKIQTGRPAGKILQIPAIEIQFGTDRIYETGEGEDKKEETAGGAKYHQRNKPDLEKTAHRPQDAIIRRFTANCIPWRPSRCSGFT
jgi:molecular chaperone HtpG